MRLKTSHSFALAGGAAVSIGALVLATAAAPAAAQSRAGSDRSPGVARKATINTYKAWDGSTAAAGVNCSGASNEGQVIKVPTGKTSLDRYSIWLADSFAGSLVMRTEVYAWDGDKATGSSLYESAPQSFPQGSAFHKVTYNTGGVAVTPGQKYLIFATLDKDYDQCQGTLGERMAAVPGDTYRRGDARYLSSSGDESQWTTQDWALEPHGYDLAMKVYLG